MNKLFTALAILTALSINSCSDNPHAIKSNFYKKSLQKTSQNTASNDPKILVAETFGNWKVICVRDIITDEKNCSLIFISTELFKYDSILDLSIEKVGANKFEFKIESADNSASKINFLLRIDQNKHIFNTNDSINNNNKNHSYKIIYQFNTSQNADPENNIFYQMSHGKRLYIRKIVTTENTLTYKSMTPHKTFYFKSTIPYDYEIPLYGFHEAINLYDKKMNEYNLVHPRIDINSIIFAEK